MSKGWIKVSRKIQDHYLWDDSEPFDKRSAWIDLLLSVNHADKKILFEGKIKIIHAGEILTSIAKLSEKWKWDRKKTRAFLNLLESDGMIRVFRTTHGTTITIENWGKYQVEGTTDGTTTTPTMGQPLPQPLPINKNVKNDKNDKEIEKGKKFTPPTLQEVTAYCMERNNGIEPQTFIDFYQAKNWMIGKSKMKDWRACIRTWESRRSKERQGTMDGLKEAYQKFERMEVIE